MIAPIFLGQDDTTIDGNGRRSLKPMYMTCGNLRVQKRNQKWANTCVGYIPKPNKNHRPSNMSKEQWKRDKRQMFHDAMAEILEAHGADLAVSSFPKAFMASDSGF